MLYYVVSIIACIISSVICFKKFGIEITIFFFVTYGFILFLDGPKSTDVGVIAIQVAFDLVMAGLLTPVGLFAYAMITSC